MLACSTLGRAPVVTRGGAVLTTERRSVCGATAALRRRQRAAPAWRPSAAAPDAAAEGAASSSGGSAAASLPGQRLVATLPKPVGVVFSQKEGGPVFIESVVPGGNADKAGIKPGDILNRCSAVTLKAGKEGRYERVGHGDRPYDNWEPFASSSSGGVGEGHAAVPAGAGTAPLHPQDAAAEAAAEIMIDTEGLKFETVMSALKSNNERWGFKTVTLVIRRPPPAEE
ncbi:hypothetical protein MNEG_3669 [Monoraphidium neglectum]|uniref:PDZ domain-containing protein n=1 Tax=Monoraphidium neglectum TaxID=145388 RepID=A0A0D2K0Z9_9CHLO|nr:hypothetical protein MNEG_3669 [Monoraphidium neglectum]KIZ04293.1 hypothetical protein MNEG_3669 [Monoraphidium neglectum]|eukprot:XP_013903312.1 hypothetical protein MNEG_3669 [Monoraphidium neglectum]